MERKSISIVYVNYKTPELLRASIASVVEHTKDCAYEIIVVDNHSEDDSKQQIINAFPLVTWFDVDYNSGFARGNNAGIALAKNEYVLIINSDTFLQEDTVSKCLLKYHALEGEFDIGLLGCNIRSFEGKVLPSVHSSFNGIKNLWNKNALAIKFLGAKPPIPYTNDWYTTSHKAAHLSGAFLLFNKQKLNAKGKLLDEDFFLYAEDVEWCYRLNKLGFEHYYYAATQINHKDSASSTDNERKKLQIVLSRLLYIFKTRGSFYYFLYTALLFFNLRLDKLLHTRTTKNIEKIFEGDGELKILVEYWLKIPFHYSRTTSSAKVFLKYA